MKRTERNLPVSQTRSRKISHKYVYTDLGHTGLSVDVLEHATSAYRHVLCWMAATDLEDAHCKFPCNFRTQEA
jgi:hypothetical protein